MVSKTKTAEIELCPDGWERFQRAVSAAAKSGPKHRPEKNKTKTSKNPVSRKR